MNKTEYIEKIPFTLHGIPCLIGVLEYDYQPPSKRSAHLCDSDWDYYGYEEMDYEILDRKGYYAKWLERKINNSDRSDIETAVSEFFKELREKYYD